MSAPNIPLAKTIAPSDTSTSIVIDGSGPRIQTGKVQLTTFRDIAYDTSTSSGTQIPLKLDVVVPQIPGRKPLVVYITGGGFLRSDKTANLDQRTQTPSPTSSRRSAICVNTPTDTESTWARSRCGGSRPVAISRR